MGEIEVRGEDVDGAIAEAAQRLGVSVDEVGYEVLHAGKKGVLGIGSREVAIRAWVSAEDSTPAEPAGAQAPQGEALGARDEEIPPAAFGDSEPMPDAEAADLVDVVLDAMDEILDGFDVDADSEAYVDPEGSVVVEISGPDLGCLIGRRGQTLEAMQYLLGRVASKTVGRRVRVIADAEGYRERRREALTELAVRTARRVAQSRRSVTLRPMPPAERRIVHMALADETHVVTHSEGEEPNRKVVIAPR